MTSFYSQIRPPQSQMAILYPLPKSSDQIKCFNDMHNQSVVLNEERIAKVEQLKPALNQQVTIEG